MGRGLSRPDPYSPVVYQLIPDEGFESESHRLEAVETGHTDTDDTTVLHVPSLGLVVAGDVAYNGVHQHLAEITDGGIVKWLHALDRVAALQPRNVVAGHRNRDLPDDPAILEQTRAYARCTTLLASPSRREFYDRMLELHPDRLNAGPVWRNAIALLPFELCENRRASAAFSKEGEGNSHEERRRKSPRRGDALVL